MMRRIVFPAGLIAAFVGASPPALAQAVPPNASVVVTAGSRVRVTAPATGRVVGTLLSATADSVQIELAGGSTLTLPKAGLSGLELSTGVRRNGWRGAGIGLLVGAGVGGVVGLATYRRAECYETALEGFFCDIVNRTSRSVTVISDAAMAGAAGAIVGALIGRVGRESWVRVPVREGTRVGVMGRSGFGVTIAM